MDSRIIDFQNSLNRELSLLEETTALLVKKNPEAAAVIEDIKKIYKDKLTDIKPQIMVFGIYNAGKSSILNELMRKDIAKVADIPTTDAVQFYNWHGYSVADTPGVGAPIKHEKVTNEAIRKADVVLFVMSASGSSEKRENYTRMKDIVDAGKKVIIVLNDKNGDMLSNQEAIFMIQQKVYENMQAMGIENVDQKFVIVCVNAAMAHKGRIENKKLLWEKSNMGELESIILTELKKTTDFDILRHTIYEISQDVNKLKLAMQTGNRDTTFDDIQKILDNLRTGKKQLRNTMNDYITSQSNRLAETLLDQIWAVKEDEDKVQAAIQQAGESLSEKIQVRFTDELGILLEDTARDWHEYAVKVEKANLETNQEVHVDIPENNIGTEAGQAGPDFSIENLTGAVAAGTMAKEAYANLAAEGSKLAADMLKSMGIKVGKKGVGAWALKKLGLDTVVKSAPFLAAIPAIPIEAIFIGYTILKHFLGDDGEYDRAVARAERENAIAEAKIQAENQARQSLQQKCIYVCDDFKDALVHWVNQAITESIGKYEKEINERLDNILAGEKQNLELAQKLSEISDDYHRMAVNLEAGAKY